MFSSERRLCRFAGNPYFPERECRCETPRTLACRPRSPVTRDVSQYTGWAAMCPECYCSRPCPPMIERVGACTWRPGMPICDLDTAAVAWLRYGAISPKASIRPELMRRYQALQGRPTYDVLSDPDHVSYRSYPRAYAASFAPRPYGMPPDGYFSGGRYGVWGDALPYMRSHPHFHLPYGGVPNVNHLRALSHAYRVADRGGTAYYDGYEFSPRTLRGTEYRSGPVRSPTPRTHSLEAPDLARFHASPYAEIRDWARRLDQIADRTYERGDRVYMGQIRNTVYEMEQAEQMLKTVDQARLTWAARGAPIRTVALPLPLSGDQSQIRIERLKDDGTVEQPVLLYQPNSRRISWSADLRLISEHGVIPTRDSNTDRNGTPRPYSGQLTFYKPGRYRVNGREIVVSGETRAELTKRLEQKERQLVDAERQIHEITEEMERATAAGGTPLTEDRAKTLIAQLRSLRSDTSRLRTEISQLKEEVAEFARPGL